MTRIEMAMVSVVGVQSMCWSVCSFLVAGAVKDAVKGGVDTVEEIWNKVPAGQMPC